MDLVGGVTGPLVDLLYGLSAGRLVAPAAALGIEDSAGSLAAGRRADLCVLAAGLDLDLISRLRKVMPVHLVLHGSSGVPDEQLRKAAHAGMVKINVGTALNIAFTRAVRATLIDPTVVDPRKYLTPALPPWPRRCGS